MSDFDFSSVSAFAHWVWPYLVTSLTTLVGFAGILQTGWGLSLLNAGIKHHFDTKIDDLRHEKNRELSIIKHAYDLEIEGLKSELSQATDRGIRSNELEYQALIKIWKRFIDAYHATHGAAGGMRSISDLQSMSDADLEEWLELSTLSPGDKKFIRKSSNKTNALSRIGRNSELNDAQRTIWDAQVTLRRQSVFVPASIEEKFEKALVTLRGVWAENHVTFDAPGSLPLKATLAFFEGSEDLKNSLRDTIRSRVLHQWQQGKSFADTQNQNS